MDQYDSFIFDSYTFDPDKGTIELRYALDDKIQFIETLTLPPEKDVPYADYDPHALDRALFALHLAGGVSYYKTCLPKTIEIRSGVLTKDQAGFWNSVYENGLGEFFYKNNIDFRNLISFPNQETNKLIHSPTNPPINESTNQRILIPIGGGKDSLVTVELLRSAGHDLTLFRMGAHPVIEALAKTAGLPLLTIKRGLSPTLFKLNEQGALNGHIPITAYLSCVTIVLSVLYGFDAVAMSSERSASEGNVEFHGKEINHQWSKSLAFERAFQKYLSGSVTDTVAYFSLLRPFSELHIAKLFAGYPQYFPLATSCNKNWKILSTKAGQSEETWCGQCPKCAFVFALFAAFLPKATLEKTFGANFFNAPDLRNFYSELLGLTGHKPFECVGTPDETTAAFLLAHKRGDLEDTTAMKMFVKDVLPTIKKPDDLIASTLTLSDDHVIPPAFRSSITS